MMPFTLIPGDRAPFLEPELEIRRREFIASEASKKFVTFCYGSYYKNAFQNV
jgi:hypothetical protein